MSPREALAAAIDALNESGIPYMVTGSFASNYFGEPRSTKDADFVLQLRDQSITTIARRMPAQIKLDPQMRFETITMTSRFDFHVEGSEFRIELFLLTDDPHDQERFRRRIAIDLEDRMTWAPTPEDIVVQKLRWSSGGKRSKDFDDAKNVIAVQLARLDWPYIEKWCREHGTLELLEKVRREAIID